MRPSAISAMLASMIPPATIERDEAEGKQEQHRHEDELRRHRQAGADLEFDPVGQGVRREQTQNECGGRAPRRLGQEAARSRRSRRRRPGTTFAQSSRRPSLEPRRVRPSSIRPSRSGSSSLRLPGRSGTTTGLPAAVLTTEVSEHLRQRTHSNEGFRGRRCVVTQPGDGRVAPFRQTLRALRFDKGRGTEHMVTAELSRSGARWLLTLLAATVAVVCLTTQPARAADELAARLRLRRRRIRSYAGSTHSPTRSCRTAASSPAPPAGRSRGGAKVASGNHPFGPAGSRSLDPALRQLGDRPRRCAWVSSSRSSASSRPAARCSPTSRSRRSTRTRRGAEQSVMLLPVGLPSSSWTPNLPMLQLGGAINALTLNGFTTDIQLPLHAARNALRQRHLADRRRLRRSLEDDLGTASCARAPARAQRRCRRARPARRARARPARRRRAAASGRSPSVDAVVERLGPAGHRLEHRLGVVEVALVRGELLGLGCRRAAGSGRRPGARRRPRARRASSARAT